MNFGESNVTFNDDWNAKFYDKSNKTFYDESNMTFYDESNMTFNDEAYKIVHFGDHRADVSRISAFNTVLLESRYTN